LRRWLGLGAACLGLAHAANLEALDFQKAINEFSHKIWRAPEGLPHGLVNAILQTRDDYVWVGTDEGLARLDGVNVTVYDRLNTQAMSDHTITGLLEDARGTLWITTSRDLLRLENDAFIPEPGIQERPVGLLQGRDGSVWVTGRSALHRFRQGAWTVHPLPEQVGQATGGAREDPQGTLWVPCQHGLTRLEDERFTAFSTEHGLSASRISALAWDSKGTLWVGTDVGLHRWDGRRFAVMTARDGLSHDKVLALHAAKDGTLWIGTQQALDRLKDGRLRRYGREEGLPDSFVRGFYEDRAGVIWFAFGAGEGGLGRFSVGKFSFFTAKDGLTTPRVTTVYEDRRGSLWIGTLGGGLNLLNDSKFITYGKREGIPDPIIWTVRESRDGSVWIGAHDGGLTRFQNGGWTQYTGGSGLRVRTVRDLFEDSKAGLWVGGPGIGLLGFRDGAFFRRSGLGTAVDRAVTRVMLEARDGTIWIGTDGAGLVAFKEGRTRTYGTAEGLRSLAVMALLEDGEGTLWVGTVGGGLYRLRGEQATSVPGVSEGDVSSLHLDRDGVVWIGTYGQGIKRWQAGRLVSYTRREGLADDRVFHILEDDFGFLWMSSNRGVFRVRKSELNDLAGGRTAAITSTLFSEADGMRSRECNGGGSPGAWKTRDGRLWFPTVSGVAVVDPGKLSTPAVPPTVRIERMLVDDAPLVAVSDLVIPPGSQRVEVHFTSPNFIAPDRVRFRYRLEPFSKGWIDAGTRRSATFTNLNPGPHRFEVMATNEDGIWSPVAAGLSFRLEPRLHQTTTFRIACGLLALCAAFGVYGLRLRQVRSRFDAVLAERSRIAREIHDTLAQGFAGIALHLESVDETLEGTPVEARRHLDQARRLVRHSLEETRRTLWDLRTGSLGPEPLVGALSAVARQLGAAVEIEVEGKPRPLPGRVEEALYRIGREALTNARKHANPNRIRVGVRFAPDRIHLIVTDDGAGFDVEASSRSGNGHFGLLGMRERAAEVGADLEVESRKGAGTTVSASVLV
jgi:ligand-binding sensor domain-containing protein